MSIIIIAFPGAPKVDPEAQKKDEALNKLLQQKVAGNGKIIDNVHYLFCQRQEFDPLFIYHFRHYKRKRQRY